MARWNGDGNDRCEAARATLVPRWASADPATGRIVVGQQAVEDEAAEVAGAIAVGLILPTGGAVLIAAENPAAPRLHYTGKIEEPTLLAGFIERWEDVLARPNRLGGQAVLAAWDFSQRIDGTAIIDAGPQLCDGTLVNLPARAAVGVRWTGQETCWRHAPGDYGAIHFHANDLETCAWQPDFSFTIPMDLRSGCYVLHLTCDAGEDWLPFYVLPPRHGPRAPIVFLASTFTYQAYANHTRGNADDAYRARVAAWGAYPHNPDDFPIYGVSTYNRHPDGSGVSLSSRLRPILTMRPGFLTFNDARGSGARHFVADSHILAWLEDKGFAYDIVTDEDLDNEGEALLAPYRAVLTGSHPEYHTLRTLDALQGYTHGGGRLAYLGGNGFYWRIARSHSLPHVIEIRRAEGGIRAWQAEPGEYYHMLDGQLGGMWRRNRRPPQQLAGVGFTGQGLFEGTHYRRLPASYEPRFAWMFDRDHRGDPRRLRAVGWRRRWVRAGPRRCGPWHAGQCRDSGPVRKPACLDDLGAGGNAVASHHRVRRASGRSDACRDRLFRDAARRCGLLGRIDHLLRQPVA